LLARQINYKASYFNFTRSLATTYLIACWLAKSKNEDGTVPGMPTCLLLDMEQAERLKVAVD